jgi:hypothetical protein
VRRRPIAPSERDDAGTAPVADSTAGLGGVQTIAIEEMRPRVRWSMTLAIPMRMRKVGTPA